MSEWWKVKKHLRAVQDYLTRLCSRYPGKVSPFEFTTLDVIARLRQETVISGVENGINPVQQKMLGYISHAATLSASDLHVAPISEILSWFKALKSSFVPVMAEL